MSSTCRVIGDYHIVDGRNGFYEVWYVSPFDDTDDYMSEWDSMHDAEWHALCYHNADTAINEAGRLR
jgi:hypothetical protein